MAKKNGIVSVQSLGEASVRRSGHMANVIGLVVSLKSGEAVPTGYKPKPGLSSGSWGVVPLTMNAVFKERKYKSMIRDGEVYIARVK